MKFKEKYPYEVAHKSGVTVSRHSDIEKAARALHRAAKKSKSGVILWRDFPGKDLEKVAELPPASTKVVDA